MPKGNSRVFIHKFEPGHQALIRAVRKALPNGSPLRTSWSTKLQLLRNRLQLDRTPSIASSIVRQPTGSDCASAMARVFQIQTISFRIGQTDSLHSIASADALARPRSRICSLRPLLKAKPPLRESKREAHRADSIAKQRARRSSAK